MPENPEPLVVAAMRGFKRALLMREAAQMTEMAARWLQVEQALSAQIEALAQQTYEMRLAGEPVSRAQIYRLERYRRLLGQTREEFAQYAGYAEGVVTRGQREMAQLGLEHAEQAVQLSYWPGVGVRLDRLPIQAVEFMVGEAGDGAPLGRLLRARMLPTYSDEQALSVWMRLTQSLIDGTAQGRNPREVARRMRDDLAGGLQKALTIARTEQLRVYRQASLEQYRASGVVRKMKRLSAHDDRVCPACIADDGRVYDLGDIIPDHPQGRCTAVPVVEGMPETRWTAGEVWFRQQDESAQRHILGPGRFEAWRAGQFDFSQLTVHTFNETWGGSVQPAPLSALVQ